MYGSDTEFCTWMRACKSLPSYGPDFGFVATDNDITVHRYKTEIDNMGSRDVQGIMQIEVKTRNGKPPQSQIDTLSKLNLFKGHKEIEGCQIRFFGVFLLIMSGTTPDNSDEMWWGSIQKNTCLTDANKAAWTKINIEKLIELLRFEIHPVNFCRVPFRRHHLTREIMVVKNSPLGFEFDEKLTERS